MKNLFTTSILGIVILLSACSTPPEEKVEVEVTVVEEPIISSEKTKEVIDHHLTAFGQNDLQAVLDDYTDESIIMTPDSTFKGLDQISGLFQGLFQSFPTEGTTFELDNMVIENEVAYIVWHATTPSVEVPLGTDTFIIEDGKIKWQTFAGMINPIQ